MKIIAHRGGKIGKENSVDAFKTAARMGVDAVECDIRKTKDGVYVIYHDGNLSRLAGEDANISDITYEKMCQIMEKSGQKVLTFDALKKEYTEKTPILLHIKLQEYDEAFAEYITGSSLPIIAGVESIDMLRCFAKKLPPERILAFMPRSNMAREFFEGGAGIIRLWEHWLSEISPADVKKECPGAKVYIMAYKPPKAGEKIKSIAFEDMDGNEESFHMCAKAGADGILLNDVEMALSCRNSL